MTRSETFIRNNYRTQSINAMAKHLTVSDSTVRRAMKANGWQPMDSEEPAKPNDDLTFSWAWAKRQDFILIEKTLR